MIQSFKDDETQKIFNRQRSYRLDQNMQRVAYRKLRMLHHSKTLNDLRAPPSNHLEKLKGKKDFPPLHPGEVLLEEFLKPLGISQNRLALNMHVAPQKINEIVRGKRSITADTALRLSIALNTSPEFWLGLQNNYDLESTLDALGDRLKKEVSPVQ